MIWLSFWTFNYRDLYLLVQTQFSRRLWRKTSIARTVSQIFYIKRQRQHFLSVTSDLFNAAYEQSCGTLNLKKIIEARDFTGIFVFKQFKARDILKPNFHCMYLKKKDEKNQISTSLLVNSHKHQRPSFLTFRSLH